MVDYLLLNWGKYQSDALTPNSNIDLGLVSVYM